MKKIKLSLLSIGISVLLFISACGGRTTSSTAETTEAHEAVAYETVAHSQILTRQDLAEMTGEESVTDELIASSISDEEVTEEVVEEIEVAEEAVEEIASEEVETVAESTGYRYQEYLLSKAGTGNAIFSGEAFLTELSAYSSMLNEQGQAILNNYMQRDYLKFNYNGDLKSVLRIFADSNNVTFSESSNLAEYVVLINMNDPAATKTKNSLIQSATDKYISSTPSGLFENTLLDISDTIYIKAAWKDGARPYDNQSRIFYNPDGSEVHTVMVHDRSDSYIITDNAMAYKMTVGDGSAYVMFILPDEGTELLDVDVEGIAEGKYTNKNADVEFYVPEFSVESSYRITLGNIGYSKGVIDEEVASGLSSYDPVFYQTTKFSVGRSGVGGAEAENVVEFPDVSEESDVINIVCNRPFLYYLYDNNNEEIAMIGVVNQITESMAVSEEDAKIAVVEETIGD